MAMSDEFAETPHLLIVDDDQRLRELLSKFLADQGFRVTAAGGADEARAKLAIMTFDLVIMDVMMPGENGLDLTAWLRDRHDVPVLMLTAMGETEDRIAGLERGADDYLAKPFEPRELLLRLRTILRRAPVAPPVVAPATEVRLGECLFDMTRNELVRGKKRLRLTTAESRLLAALAAQPGAPLSREDLIAAAGIAANDRAIDVQVTRLRRKIEKNPRDPRYLQTVRGKGYTLIPD
ncbi:MAG: response regulator [Alphaproteobacteria bacterium]